MSAAAALVAVRWVHFASAGVLFGLAMWPAYVPALVVGSQRTRAALRVASTACALVALLTAVAWLLCEGALLTGDGSRAFDPVTLRTVLEQTAFGGVWRVRLGLACALVGLCWWFGASTRRRARVLLASWSGVLFATLALTGHPAAEPGLAGVVHRAADALHLLAAGAWLGGLIAIAVLLVLAAGDDRRAGAALEHASALAPLAVALLAFAGIVDAWFTFAGWGGLVGSMYGRVLLAKVLVFVAMLVLAALNRWHFLPRMLAAPDRSRAARAFAWVLGVEQLAGLGALFLAALLGTLAPPTAPD